MIVKTVAEWEAQRRESARDAIVILFILFSRSSPGFFLLKKKRQVLHIFSIFVHFSLLGLLEDSNPGILSLHNKISYGVQN